MFVEQWVRGADVRDMIDQLGMLCPPDKMDEIYVRGFWRRCGPEMKRHVDEYRRQRYDQQYDHTSQDVNSGVRTACDETTFETKTGQRGAVTDTATSLAERRPPQLVSENGTRQSRMQAHTLQPVLRAGPTQAINKTETSSQEQHIEDFE